MVKDQSFDKRLSYFSKSHSSSECKKARFCLFGLKQISIFFSNLIINFIINFIVNLNVTNPTSIKLTSVMSSFVVTTNPNSALPKLCGRLNTL